MDFDDDHLPSDALPSFFPKKIIDTKAIKNAKSWYVNSINRKSDLVLRKPDKLIKILETEGPIGLFFLFFSKNMCKNIVGWSNESITTYNNGSSNRIALIEKKEFQAYIGLSLAMAISHFDRIEYYWSNKRFLGNKDFVNTMGRNRFTQICSNLRLCPENIPPSTPIYDSLWEVRPVLQNFIQNCTITAIPCGAVVLDECSINANHQFAPKTFCQGKRDKQSVRMYAVVGYRYQYLYLLWENKIATNTYETQIERFDRYFRRVTRVNNYYILLRP